MVAMYGSKIGKASQCKVVFVKMDLRTGRKVRELRKFIGTVSFYFFPPSNRSKILDVKLIVERYSAYQ